MSPERTDKFLNGLALMSVGYILCGFTFVALGYFPPPQAVKQEPELWCPKRLLGFHLVAEKLELEAFPRAESSFGTLTCKLERKRPVEEIQREVEAKDHPPAKGKKR